MILSVKALELGKGAYEIVFGRENGPIAAPGPIENSCKLNPN
jgi:hypothetical protein